MGKSSGNGDSRGGLKKSHKDNLKSRTDVMWSINGGTILIRSTVKVLENHQDTGFRAG